MNFQSCCTIQNPKNKKSPCSLSLSLTDDPAPHVSDPKQSARRRYRLRPTKRAGGEASTRQTVLARPTPPRESTPTPRTAAGTPEEAPRRPWRPRWRRHGGTRDNSGYNTVETKTKRASRSGAHREHDGVLGEGGDGLEWPGHGEVGDGGASVGSEEESDVRWCWTARGEVSRPGRS